MLRYWKKWTEIILPTFSAFYLELITSQISKNTLTFSKKTKCVQEKEGVKCK